MSPLLLTALLSHAGPVAVVLAQAPTPRPQAPAPGAPSAPSDEVPEVPPPFQPQVSDPLLTPVPPAPQNLASWDEALNLVRQRSTDLRTALAQVEVAAGQWRVALASLLPTITGTIAVQLNVLDPDATTFIGGGGSSGGISGGTGTGSQKPTKPLGVGLLTASVPVVDLSDLYALGSAKETRRTAALSLAETRRQLTRALAEALVAEVSAERLTEVNRTNLRTALERQALAERRFELGAGTRLDVVRVQQDTEAARTNVVTGDERLRQTRESLGLALGFDSQVGLKHGLELTDVLSRARNDCRALGALADRPDLAAARSRLLVAERAVGVVKRQYLPTLDLTSTTVALSVDPGFATVPAWNVGAALVLPFWDGGVREGLLRSTRAQAEQARQDVVALEREVSVEVAQARRAVDVARAARDIASRQRALAEENDRLTRRSFEVGTGTSLELVESAGDLRQAELELVVREFQLQQAQVDAFLAEAACDW